MSEKKLKAVVSVRSSEEFRSVLGKVLDMGINIVTVDEAENSDIVVCVRADSEKYFDDDVYTVCAQCSVAIRHRPYAPKTPPKVCFACAQMIFAGEEIQA
jgi:hypothetical protein